MKQELQDKLVEKYPKIFIEVGMTIQESCMAEGICTGDGWYWLIDQLCEHLQFNIDKNEQPQLVAVQVKEKFGGLRFYIRGASDKQHDIVGFAEDLSCAICEYCGSTENVTRTTDGWIRTECAKCEQKRTELTTE